MKDELVNADKWTKKDQKESPRGNNNNLENVQIKKKGQKDKKEDTKASPPKKEDKKALSPKAADGEGLALLRGLLSRSAKKKKDKNGGDTPAVSVNGGGGGDNASISAEVWNDVTTGLKKWSIAECAIATNPQLVQSVLPKFMQNTELTLWCPICLRHEYQDAKSLFVHISGSEQCRLATQGKNKARSVEDYIKKFGKDKGAILSWQSSITANYTKSASNIFSSAASLATSSLFTSGEFVCPTCFTSYDDADKLRGHLFSSGHVSSLSVTAETPKKRAVSLISLEATSIWKGICTKVEVSALKEYDEASGRKK